MAKIKEVNIMAKNNIFRLTAFLIIFSLLFSAFGCKKKEEVHSEIEQPVFENNTAVVKYTSIDAEGKEVIVSTVVSRRSKTGDNDSQNNNADNSNTNKGSKENNMSNGGNNNQKSVTNKESKNKETTTTVKAKVVTVKSKTKASNTKPYVAEKIDAELSMGMKVKQMFNTEDSKQRFIKNCNETYKITPEKAKSILE
ncbi:MAG: hypothetical protein KBT46_07880, partial [Ruminococcus sp.]|nr:hypothetical protein [Candidatus Copronaster equi]